MENLEKNYFKKEYIAWSKDMEDWCNEIIQLITDIFIEDRKKADKYWAKFFEITNKIDKNEVILCKDISEIIDNMWKPNIQLLFKNLKQDIINNFTLSKYVKSKSDINKNDLLSDIETQIIKKNIKPNTPIINQMLKMTSNLEDAMSIVDRYTIKVELVNLHLLLYKTNNIEEAKMILEKYSKDCFVDNDTHRVLQKKFPGQKIWFLLKPYRKKKE